MKNLKTGTFGAIVAALAALVFAGAAFAQVGQPVDGQMGLQGSVTPVMTEIHSFYDLVNIIIIAITIFVMVLMAVVMVRFNRKANPDPSTTTHNTMIEVVWTVVPVLILVFIGIFSFKLLFLQYEYPKPDLTIKATANAWFWEHSYQDHDGATVTSNMLTDADLLKAEMGDDKFEAQYGKSRRHGAFRRHFTRRPSHSGPSASYRRQLSVDNEIAVPVNAVVHMLVTSNDVIHGWTIPSFGSKTCRPYQGASRRLGSRRPRPASITVSARYLCGLKHSGDADRYSRRRASRVRQMAGSG